MPTSNPVRKSGKKRRKHVIKRGDVKVTHKPPSSTMEIKVTDGWILPESVSNCVTIDLEHSNPQSLQPICPEDFTSFRSNILNESAPRKFGTYGELIIERINDIENPIKKASNIHHDGFSDRDGRIEVKFSRAKCPREKITLKNFKSCISSPSFVDYRNRYNYDWDCNIQQIKPSQFDTLYYGLMFWDKILIFKINNETIEKDAPIGYCPKQHKGNIGEGQFHIKPRNFEHHYENYIHKEMTWEELFMLF